MKIKILIVSIFALLALIFFTPVFSQNTSSYFSRANSMLVSGKFEEAVSLYNTAIQQNPKYADAYVGLGIAYKEMGKYSEAEAATLQAIKLNPNYYQSYYNLGLIYEKQNKAGDAINAYEKFLDEVPGSEKFSDAKLRIARLKKYFKQ